MDYFQIFSLVSTENLRIFCLSHNVKEIRKGTFDIFSKKVIRHIYMEAGGRRQFFVILLRTAETVFGCLLQGKLGQAKFNRAQLV